MWDEAAPRSSKVRVSEGWMRPGSDVAAASLRHRLRVGAGEQLWRKGVRCQWDFSQLLPHGLFPAASQAAATAHLSWPGHWQPNLREGKWS